jgi:hypothetical protein
VNDITKYIGPALTAILVPLVLGWLFRSANAEAKNKHGIAWLDYGVAMKGLTLFFVAIIAALVVAWFNVTTKDRNAVLCIITLFSGITLPMAIEVFLVRIGFDSERIYCHSGWRTKRVIDWSDVESAHFSTSMQWWVIRTKKAGKIRVSVYLSGLPEILVELHKRGIKIPLKQHR